MVVVSDKYFIGNGKAKAGHGQDRIEQGKKN